MESVEQTRQELAQHKALPLGRRVVRRMLGRYPKFQAREAVRRAGLAPAQLIEEDLQQAIDYSAEAQLFHRTPRVQNPLDMSKKIFVSYDLPVSGLPSASQSVVKQLAGSSAELTPSKLIGVFKSKDPGAPISGLYLRDSEDSDALQLIPLDAPSIEKLLAHEQQQLQHVVANIRGFNWVQAQASPFNV